MLRAAGGGAPAVSAAALAAAVRRDPRAAAALESVAELESPRRGLLLETLLDWRLEARLEAEAARAVAAAAPASRRQRARGEPTAASGGWLSWLSWAGDAASPAPTPLPEPDGSTVTPGFDATARRAELERVRRGGSAMRVRRVCSLPAALFTRRPSTSRQLPAPVCASSCNSTYVRAAWLCAVR